MTGLLDTDVIVRLGRLDDPELLPDDPRMSSITLGELLVGVAVAKSDDERDARRVAAEQAEADFEVVPFDKAAARALAGVARSLRRQGRKLESRSFDALIAACALANDMPLYTANGKDFRGIDGLRVVDVPLH